MDPQTIKKILSEEFGNDKEKMTAYINSLTTDNPAPAVAPAAQTTTVAPPDVASVNNSATAIIRLENVTKEYKKGIHKVVALNNVSFTINKGEFVALVGPSGSGKSTILHLIGGLDKPTSGQVMVNGNDLNKMKDHELSIYRNNTLGFVFQEYYLQPFLNVLQNVQLPLFFRDIRDDEALEMTRKAIEAVGLTDRIYHLPKELSGGQMQRAGFARAIAANPHILLADEPTANLDKDNTQAIVDLMKKINNDFGTTIVVVTHNEKIAAQAKRIITLENGEIK